ncbi:MAG: hypothetical protein DRH56_09410 [Deltaproteobacteria bacterium]|nr:MAG: hypothetical protein DRH56_09410 [Deltaproteobacteria bacterium]
MNLQDLGFTKKGFHDARLTPVESRFLGILWEHEGVRNAIPADILAVCFRFGCTEEQASYMRFNGEPPRRVLDKWKRDVRYMQNHILRWHNHAPVLSRAGSGGGYWLAESESEAEAFYDTFRRRGLTGLVKASRGRQAALVDMVSQLSFEFEELADMTPQCGPVWPRAETPTPVQVVDAFLERMLADPGKFADGLRKIGDKYGAVLLPRDHLAEVKAKAAELQQLITGVCPG